VAAIGGWLASNASRVKLRLRCSLVVSSPAEQQRVLRLSRPPERKSLGVADSPSPCCTAQAVRRRELNLSPPPPPRAAAGGGAGSMDRLSLPRGASANSGTSAAALSRLATTPLGQAASARSAPPRPRRPLLACIGSPCLRHCVHGASIGGHAAPGGGGREVPLARVPPGCSCLLARSWVLGWRHSSRSWGSSRCSSGWRAGISTDVPARRSALARCVVEWGSPPRTTT
jgi:hypothetical protein